MNIANWSFSDLVASLILWGFTIFAGVVTFRLTRKAVKSKK